MVSARSSTVCPVITPLGRTAYRASRRRASRLGPASTWTYLVSDDPFRDQLGLMLTGPGKTTMAVGAAMFAMPLMLAWLLVERFFRRRKK